MTESLSRIWNHDRSLWERLRSQRIFVTGGTGFFGRSLLDVVSSLNAENHLNLGLTVLTRDIVSFQKKFPRYSNSDWLEFVQGEVENFEFPDGNFDQILHFATPASATLNLEDPLRMFNIIVDGSRRVLEFSRYAKVKNVLLASSGAVYGRQPVEILNLPEDYLGAPATDSNGSAYGEAKRVAELLGNLYSSKYGFGHKTARCFAFVGPHLDRSGTFAIGNFIGDSLAERDIEIKGDGTALRSYLYADDLILWLFKILIDGKNQQAYNVGSDVSLSIENLGKEVVSALGSTSSVKVRGYSPSDVLPERYVPSIKKAVSELNLKVLTPLAEAIRLSAKV